MLAVVPERAFGALEGMLILSALATTVACGPQDTATPRAQAGTPGAGGSADGNGSVGAGTGAVGAGASTTVSGGMQAGGTTIGGATAMGAAGAGTTAPGASAAQNCPTYQDDFVPQVYEPVCSKCHDGSNSKAPNWGQYSVASASCGTIGDLVASGAMPPASAKLPLDAAQKALVAAWVGLGCPENASALPASCQPSSQGPGYPEPSAGSGGASTGTPPSGAGGASTGTPAAGAPSSAGGTGTTSGSSSTVVLAVTRAEWDADKETLRLEGTVSDVTATLTAEFGGRTEPLANDAGRFRNEFTNVVSDPPTVTVRTGGGAIATSPVTAK